MVYHGPSGGCRTCRTRRVKCDQTRPQCNNCIRRREACPGYGDVFDGAHRNQNKGLVRRMERMHIILEAQANRTTSSGRSTIQLSRSTSETSSQLSSPLPGPQLQWIIYSAPTEQQSKKPEEERNNATISNHSSFDGLTSTIPDMIKQDPEEASICFFFRYYTGVIHDPHTSKTFTMLWQPLYLQSSSDSPLRMATAAITVNIAMMWNFQGCDTNPARRLYAKAISATRQALSAPSKRDLDELLMTTLIFDLYESLLVHYLPELPQPGRHKQGALALVKHMGASNFATELGRQLVGATRHALLHCALAWRTPLPPGTEQYFEHPSITDSYVKQLDMLAFPLTDAQGRFWALRDERLSGKDLVTRRRRYEDVIAEAIRIDNLLAVWKRNITDPEWLPQYVLREEVAPTIQAAGFYGDRCTVWDDLAFANIWNVFHDRRLLTLQMIRQAYADEPGMLENPGGHEILDRVNSAMQTMVDRICETVPFHIGDTVVPTNPIYSKEINFPHKITTNPFTGRTTIIPGTDSRYETHAAAAGGWMIFAHLIVVSRLAEPEDDAVPLVLREGQLEWIKGQIKRLQTIFLFCDPLWFKRLLPRNALTSNNT